MPSSNQQMLDEKYMRLALDQAGQAAGLGEIPVGAVVVIDDRVVSVAHNRCIVDCDPSAHAEILALRQAAQAISSFRIDGATLYVTLEPCLMCCGALLQARVSRLVFGSREPRTGGVVSVHESLRLPGIDHHIAITEGPLAINSAELMRHFFKSKRQ